MVTSQINKGGARSRYNDNKEVVSCSLYDCVRVCMFYVSVCVHICTVQHAFILL